MPVKPGWDYGEGKSREQEARDSKTMLGLVVLSGLIAIAVIVALLILL